MQPNMQALSGSTTPTTMMMMIGVMEMLILGCFYIYIYIHTFGNWERISVNVDIFFPIRIFATLKASAAFFAFRDLFGANHAPDSTSTVFVRVEVVASIVNVNCVLLHVECILALV